MEQPISIIGAGIGGLTTALVLQQHGLPVQIYEAAPAIRPVGAGILLAHNAMQVFRGLGLHDKIAALGNRIASMNITDAQLRSLSVSDLSYFDRKYGVHNVAIHRGALQQLLAQELGEAHIKLNKRLLRVEQQAGLRLHFKDGSTAHSQILIGADGIKSVVREQLIGPAQLRPAKQICWRGLCSIDLSPHYLQQMNEAWGRGRRFGFVCIAPQRVYWYALVNSDFPNASPAILAEIFADFHLQIQAILAATPAEQIIENEIIDLKPIDHWHAQGLCLVGDAAHATTPNLGQGACQAIEDAHVLGLLLEEGYSLADCFARYESIRRPKALQVINTSWQVGKIAQLNHPSATWLRNTALRLSPAWVNRKQLDYLFQLNTRSK